MALQQRASFTIGRTPTAACAARAAAISIAVLTLGGCTFLGDAADDVLTVGVTAAVTGATGSPVLGAAAGLATSFGADQGVKYAERRIQENVQDAIADAAGPLPEGASARWEVTATLPLSDRTGIVEVARVFGWQIPCKEIVYTVEDRKGSKGFYVATICRDDEGWHWAVSEPSVYRWGSLQ